MRLFHTVDCIETVDGILLTWKMKEGVIPKSFVVCGTNKNRTWEIKSPIISTCRCMIQSDSDGLSSLYIVKVQTMSGDYEESEPVAPQALDKLSRRLLKEIKRREYTVYKSHPFGAFDTHILLRRQIGKPCETCGTGRCGVFGGTAVDPSCPCGLGTGIAAPYFLYPRTEKVLGVPAKDDKLTGTPGVQRLAVTQTFRTVFSGVIREDDMLVVGNEVYSVLSSDIPASVGNTPAVYQLTCTQLLDEDPRRKAIINQLRERNAK